VEVPELVEGPNPAAMEPKGGTPESPQKNGKMFFYQAFVKKQKCRKKEIKIFTKNCMPNKD